MKLVLKEARVGGNTLPIGKHIVEIISCEMSLSNENNVWADRTPQVKCVFSNEHGRFTQSFNLQGFEHAIDKDNQLPKSTAKHKYSFRSFNEDSEKFLCVQTAGSQDWIRVQSEKRTMKLMQTINDLLINSGACEVDSEIDTDDLPELLAGCEIGICIGENDRGKKEVRYTLSPSKVEPSAVIAE